jgi:cellobiose epimerase
MSAEFDAAVYRRRAVDELRGNILPFWLRHARDPQGGFWGSVDNQLQVDPDAPRGVLLTTRILWTFSAAYRRYGDRAYLEMATVAYADLCTRFWDQRHGGLRWSTTAAGEPLDRRKQIYAQAFGIYALSEYYRVTRRASALARAVTLHRLIEQHAHDGTHGGYFETFTADWRRVEDETPGFTGRAITKSQNTMMHVMEAYTNLLRVWPEAGLTRKHSELIELVATRMVDESSGHMRAYFNADWTPAADVFFFGHDIECSWLIVEAAEGFDDHLKPRIRALAIDLARLTAREGIDVDGGLLYEASPAGVLVTDKHWWAQSEAVVGFLNAWELTREAEFLDAFVKVWGFIEARMIDRVNGEWFGSVTRDGQVLADPPRIGFWKCPYHNARACMELDERLARLGQVERDGR